MSAAPRSWRRAMLVALPLLMAAGIAYVATRPAPPSGTTTTFDLPRRAAAEIALSPSPAAALEPDDPAQLALWLAPRADAGNAVAQYRLGALYALGKGIDQDYARAAPLLRAAAESGLAEAQFDYGVLCENGYGVPRDAAVAAAWYGKAAAQGNGEAALNLGYAAARGNGIARDIAAAARWFRQAAERGVVDAQYNLGFLYEHGQGVTQSAIDGYAWYAIAAARGDDGARRAAEHLAKDLSGKQLESAETRKAELEQAIKAEP